MTIIDFFTPFMFLGIGCFYCWMMSYLGANNNVENPLEKHIALRVLGVISIVIGAFNLVMGTVIMRDLRSFDLTAAQNVAISHITGAFLFIGWGLYLLCFRKSGTNWRQKVLKIVAYVAMSVLLPSIMPSFNDFNIIPFLVFIVIAILCVTIKEKKNRGINEEERDLGLVGDEGKKEEIELTSKDVEL